MIRQATLPFLFFLSPSSQRDPATALERRLRRAVLRRQPVALGTVAAPYEPVAGKSGENPLRRVLLPEEGLEIAITTGSPRILRELDLLAELDRRHSVAVRMVVTACGGDDPEPRLRAVRGLAAEGIATSLLFWPVPESGGEETVRFLLGEALAAGALDAEIDARGLGRNGRASLLATFRRLRLEYGFPRRASGRG